MSRTTLGIDISKEKMDVALYQGESYQLGQFSNDEAGFAKLQKWLKKKEGQGCSVCIEATGRYGEAVALHLHQLDYPVSVVNPARIKAYGKSQLKRNKTDREDAKVIAHFCETQKPDLWQPLAPEKRDLQALVRRLDSLKRMRTQESNRLHAGLVETVVLEDIHVHLAFLDERIKVVSQQIQALVEQHPKLKQQRDLLVSIPGISDITAAKFLAEVADVSQFDSAAQLAAYAGLTPRRNDSGLSVHKRSRLSKTGNSRFRTAFYMPAVTAIIWNPIVKALADRLAKKGKEKMVIIGAAMRKLIHLAYGVLKTEKPFDPNYLQNGHIRA